MRFEDRVLELRREAQLTQRDLADSVHIAAAYLSKIERGKVSPPSKAVLRGLARELCGRLGRDEQDLSDELHLLGGKIPSDLAEALMRNPDIVRMLRRRGKEK